MAKIIPLNPPENNPNMAAALKLAEAGFPVFPVSQERSPLVKWKRAATDDLAQVRRWWSKWPEAMPAMPTGSKSGVSVLDIDLKKGKDGYAELRRLGIDPEALSHVRVKTPSGGEHIYFKHPKGLGNSVSKIAPGLDVRGERGYVHALGAVSDHIEHGSGVFEALDRHLVDDVLGLPEWPESLRQVRRKPELAPSPKASDATDHDIAWARKKLDDVCAELAAAEPGGRNHALNRAAHYLGGIEAVGLLDAQEIGYRLLAACAANGLLREDGSNACSATIKSGRKSGRLSPRYPPDPPVTEDDFEDLRTEEDFDDPDQWAAFILGEPIPEALAKSKTGGLTFMSPADCEEEAQRGRGYVVKGLIGPGQIGCIFGDPGAGKSLIAPNIAYAVAQGRETFGMRTKAAPVFYVAAEDEAGMQERVRALRAEHGEAHRFKLVKGVSNLLAKDSPDLKALRQAVKDQRPGLIVIDTLSIAFPGLEENSAEGMGRVVAVARALTKWGAAVILVHHGTKAEGNTPRGHSLFNGALDMALHLKAKDQNGIVRGKMTKNRNGSCDLDIAFNIDVRTFGHDADGDPIEAPFASELPPGAGAEPLKLTKAQRGLVQVFHELLDGADSVDESELRKAAIEGCRVSCAEDRDSRRRSVSRTIQELVQKNVMAIEHGRFHLVGRVSDDFEDLSDEGADQ